MVSNTTSYSKSQGSAEKRRQREITQSYRNRPPSCPFPRGPCPRLAWALPMAALLEGIITTLSAGEVRKKSRMRKSPLCTPKETLDVWSPGACGMQAPGVCARYGVGISPSSQICPSLVAPAVHTCHMPRTQNDDGGDRNLHQHCAPGDKDITHTSAYISIPAVLEVLPRSCGRNSLFSRNY